MADQPQPEDQPYDPLPPVSPPEDLPVTPELHEVPVMAARRAWDAGWSAPQRPVSPAAVPALLPAYDLAES